MICRRGIVQLGSSFGSTYAPVQSNRILLLFPMRVAGAHAYICSHGGGESLAPVSL